jgi:hypothetical protein
MSSRSKSCIGSGIKYRKNAFLRQSKALKQHFNGPEMYLLSFKVRFKVIFGVQTLFFV